MPEERAIELARRNLVAEMDNARADAAHRLGKWVGHDPEREKAAAAMCLQLLKNTANDKFRYDIIYALSLLRHRPTAVELLEISTNPSESNKARGQAIEAIGSMFEGARSSSQIYEKIAAGLMPLLASPSTEVRFWTCYALGIMRCKAAKPELEEVATSDPGRLAGWWSVKREARDALKCIETGQWPD